MNFSASSLFVALFVSTIGFALFLYGKKDTKIPYLLIGIVMMFYPYFITNAVWMLGVCIALLFALYFLTKMGY